MYVRELRVSYRRRRVPGRHLPIERIVGPREAGLAFVRLLHDEPVEVAGLFCLSTRGHVLAYHELSRGTLDTSWLHPREIFKVALLANAASIVLGHNHPSGDPTPSHEDLIATQRTIRVAEIIGVDLLDHIIVGGHQFLSLKERSVH